MEILHPFVPASRDTGRQEATWRALAALRRTWAVRDVPVGQDGRYEQAVRAAWTAGDAFTICEHDIEPTAAHLTELAACPAPACAWAYRYGLPATERARLDRLRTQLADVPESLLRQHEALAALLDTWALADTAVVHRIQTNGRWRLARPGDRWADRAGFGLVRFRPAVLPQPAAWTPGPWATLDTRVTRWLRAAGVRVHLHWDEPWPVHHHFCACHADDPATQTLTQVASGAPPEAVP